MLFTQPDLLGGAAHFRCALPARFQDCDAAGILFYGRVFDYFHDGYVAFLATIGHPLHEVIAERRWIAPMKHAEADYLRPIRFGDALSVALVRARFEGSVLTLGYRITGAPGEASPCAIGQTVHVWVDPETFRRTEAPADLVQAFSRIG